MTGRPDFLDGIESTDSATFFRSLRAMLNDLGIANDGLSDDQLEAAVVLFQELYASSELQPNDRHEVLYRFAKAGGLPWLALLADIHRAVTDSPGNWTQR